LLQFPLELLVRVGTHHLGLAAGLGAEPLNGSFFDLLADPRQIRRVEPFPAQNLADRLRAVLGLQENLELLLRTQIRMALS
jgi:hypothetical protein